MDTSHTIPLKHIDVSGRLDDLMLQGRLAFHFQNTGEAPAEVIYTFPLPHRAIVTGLAVTDAEGAHHEADILDRQTAEDRYEKVAAIGRSTVILSSSQEDLATLSLGELAPGESLVAEVAFFQLLDIELDAVRLVIPLTAGDRYSADGRQGKLLPYEEVKTSMLVEYPVTASFVIDGELAASPVAAPSFHPKVERLSHTRTRVTIKNAFADRNLVLVLSKVPSRRTGLVADDAFASDAVVLAERLPADFAAEEKPLRLDILVDASSFMAGAGLVQAREALAALSDHLTENDDVSFMRFGTHPDIVVRHPSPFTARFRRNVYQPAIEQTEATLGAPAADKALQSLPRRSLDTPKGVAEAALLITTGCLWDAEPLIEAASACDRRLFILGVSSHAVEGPLEEAARVSGGLCTIAGVGEDLAPIIDRMVQAMRRTKRPCSWTSFGHRSFLDTPPFSLKSRLQVFRSDESPFDAAPVDVTTSEALDTPVCWLQASEPILARRLSQAAAFERCAESDDAALAIKHRVLTTRTSWLVSGLPVND